jgi:dipeptidase E
MQLYLSSFRVGDRSDALRTMAEGRTLGFVPNALDHVESEARESSNVRSLAEVRDLGIAVEVLDFRQYFGKPNDLRARLRVLSGVWVRGGNTFVLRQAMHLSGFDAILTELVGADFLYAGYSAGICVLAPSLEGLQHVDDSTVRPYENVDVIWSGVGILDYLILPHYKSDHPESADIDTEVAYCLDHGIPLRTLRDGEVIVIDDLARGCSA